jgi:hypothetical protein
MNQSSPLSIDFDYSIFPSNEAEFLRSAAEYVNTRTALAYEIICQAGLQLIEVQQFINERFPRQGRFAQWVRHTLSINEDTAYNYMRTAANMGSLNPDTAEKIQQRALYFLARTSTDPAVREEAIERASAGIPVDDKDVFILAGHPEVKRRYIEGDLSKVQAAGLVKVIKETKAQPEAVSQLLGWGVKEPAVAAYLLDASRQTENRTTWQDVVNDDGRLNGIEWSVPVGEATEYDLARWKADRQTMHLIHHNAEQPQLQRYEVRGIIRRVGQQILIEVTGGESLPLDALNCRAFIDFRVKPADIQEDAG